MKDNDILWLADQTVTDQSQLHYYRLFLKNIYNLELSGYESLWEWSVEQPDFFWESLTAFFKIKFHSTYKTVLSGVMPDAIWFDESTLNYAEHVFLGMTGQKTAIIFTNEAGV